MMENVSNTSRPPIPDHPSLEATLWFLTVSGPVLLIAGTVGNLLSFAVILKQIHHGAAYVYLLVLCASDTIQILISEPWFILWAATRGRINLIEKIGCNVFHFLYYVTSYMSMWMVMCVTVDRAYRTYLDTQRGKKIVAPVIIGGLFLAAVSVSWHTVGGMQARDQSQYIVFPCVGRNEFIMGYQLDVFPYLDIVFYSAIPCSVILVSNVLLVWKMYRAQGIVSPVQPQVGYATTSLSESTNPPCLQPRDPIVKVAVISVSANTQERQEEQQKSTSGDGRRRVENVPKRQPLTPEGIVRANRSTRFMVLIFTLSLLYTGLSMPETVYYTMRLIHSEYGAGDTTEEGIVQMIKTAFLINQFGVIKYIINLPIFYVTSVKFRKILNKFVCWRFK